MRSKTQVQDWSKGQDHKKHIFHGDAKHRDAGGPNISSLSQICRDISPGHLLDIKVCLEWKWDYHDVIARQCPPTHSAPMCYFNTDQTSGPWYHLFQMGFSLESNCGKMCECAIAKINELFSHKLHALGLSSLLGLLF